jgi:hypothetical protein
VPSGFTRTLAEMKLGSLCGLLCASGLAAGCTRSASAVPVATTEQPAPVATVEQPTPEQQPALDEQPSPPPGTLPTSIPAHGIESPERVCEAITTILAQAHPHASIEDNCTVADAVLAEHGRAGVLPAYDDEGLHLEHFPVIQGEAGWSVFAPALRTWDYGNEVNCERTGVTFEAWTSDTLGELIMIDIASVTSEWGPDGWLADEHHWRKVICAPSGATPRCTAAIIHRMERYEPKSASRKRAWLWQAKLRLDGDSLVLDAPKRPAYRLAEPEDGVFLQSGRHSLEQLFGANPAWRP